MTDPQINTAPIKRLILSGFPLLLLGLAGGFVLHRALPPPVALPEHEAEVKAALQKLSNVKKVVTSGVGNAPELISEHLF